MAVLTAEDIPDEFPRDQNGYVIWDQVLENLDAVALPPGEKFGVESDEEGEEEEDLQEETGFGSVLVVDNLPQVEQTKFDKLCNVVRRIFEQIGSLRPEGGLVMPVEKSTGKTKGFAFIEFLTQQMAEAAVQQTDGYKLDKNHIFKVSKLDDVAKYMKVPESYTPPAKEAYVPKENMQSYMLDERGRDQYAIRFADETHIYWNDEAQSKPDEVHKRSYWTESYVQWSPNGTFLSTIHRQGVAFWGGPNFTRLGRVQHANVQFVDFSPDEKFVMTGSTQEPSNPRDSMQVTINIFDSRSGRKLRTFPGSIDDFIISTSPGMRTGMIWPIFKWAGGCGDNFFARLAKNQISVYSTVDMGLLDKKSIKLEAVQDFQWSPAAPILSVYQPELAGGNQPARVSLIEIPSRKEVRSKNLFSVSDIKMYWQAQGKYLAVKVERFTKTKKSTYSGFEFFRLHERECPMEVLELPDKNEKIVAFAWEPKGHRFAIIHGDGPRPDISFYTMHDGTQSKLKHITTLKGKQANMLCWSPQGKHIILAGLKGMNGQLEFFNADEMESMGTAEHFMCTDIDWDPTGRFVSTSVTAVHQSDNGYHVWSFNGRLIYKALHDGLYQFIWRPRLASLLTAEAEQDIFSNLKKYQKRFEEIDEQIKNAQSKEEAGERKMLLDEWNKWLASKKQHLESPLYRQELARLLDGRAVQEDPDLCEEEREVEELISNREEILNM
mmetsp:Transcript_7434/g.24695  ORF Transcript_7434/g.24695 Transcript_7434/m.24695 type:complete len:720 (+) Transcript_7434:103-2262(+)|eukprot:CAMPEP_0170142968 /NCGR_PEP_ID=MMETSP0033_2-20121228/9303_1 /TAXON_ID=195969 /ORGANISM="Dolichomastix tenuilepis, Strain CCMP3274" /LENGTH=719 /DNA_ID=CAMNT_0010379379 /DNA_START=83 /DNA_END=2242 /DNA_ORIENTATION=-